jgi:hypothetical protein
MYAQLLPMAMFWKYDEAAKLVGEDVFMLTDPTYEPIAEGGMFDVEEMRAIARSFLKD